MLGAAGAVLPDAGAGGGRTFTAVNDAVLVFPHVVPDADPLLSKEAQPVQGEFVPAGAKPELPGSVATVEFNTTAGAGGGETSCPVFTSTTAPEGVVAVPVVMPGVDGAAGGVDVDTKPVGPRDGGDAILSRPPVGSPETILPLASMPTIAPFGSVTLRTTVGATGKTVATAA